MTATFEVIGATPLLRHALPTLGFALRATESKDPFPRPIYAIALRVEIMIEASHRIPGLPRRGRVALFDDGERWAPPRRSLWRRVDTLVPSFSGSTTFLVRVPYDFDHEAFANRYFQEAGDREPRLTFRFSGTVFYEAFDGRLTVEPLDHDAHAAFRLSTHTWRELMERYHPRGDWVRLSSETFELLRAHRATSGAMSYDSAIWRLLDRHHLSLRVRT